jgi:transposase
MEEQWYADRCRLREVLRVYPDWSKRQVAEHLGRSLGWVKKWRRRLRDGPAGDDRVLRGHSRAAAPAAADRRRGGRAHPRHP